MLKKVPIFIFSVVFATFFVLFQLFFDSKSALDGWASYAVYPFIFLSSKVVTPVKHLMKNIISHQDLIAMNAQLKIENNELLLELIKLKSLEAYLGKSKDIIEFLDRYKLENAILSKILIKTFTNKEHSFIVNRGEKHGVKPNMVAIYKFQLLGRVSNVFPYYSKIALITDRHSKISAYANTTNSCGVLEGSNTMNLCKLLHISHLKPVQKGDLIFSSGHGMVYPEGFCLGKISSIEMERLCHKINVIPLIAMDSIEMCHLTSQAKMNLF